MGQIKIQPEEQPGNVLPYPYFINEDGKVGRQDWWKGNPYRLIGFSNEPKAGEIVVSLSQFKENPILAVGKYPVFANKKDAWVTQLIKIESVGAVKDK